MSFNYKGVFYYLESRSGKHYVRHETSKPAIDRWVHGHPDYWIASTTPKDPSPKKLILADWSAQGWSVDKIKRVQTAIKQLMDDGFEVYLWQQGLLQPLRENTLSCLNDKDVRSAMMPPGDDAELIRAAATQHRIAFEKIHILDDYWVNYLLNKDEILKPRTINFDEFRALKRSKASKLSVIERLKKSTPPLSAIEVNDFSNGLSSVSNALSMILLREHFPAINVWKIPLQLTLDQDNLDTDTTLAAPVESGWEDIQLCLDEPCIQLIKQITFRDIDESTSSFWQKIQYLLAQCSELKTLRFSNCELEHSLEQAHIPNLPNLQNFRVSKAKLTSNDLTALLTKTPNLNNLHLDGYDGEVFTTLVQMKQRLTSIREVTLLNGDLSGDKLQHFFLIAPHIEKMTLLNNVGVNLLASPTPNFTHLKELCLSELSLKAGSERLSTDTLRSIILAAPNLEVLDLSFCKEIEGAFEGIPPLSLQHLKVLNCASNAASILDILTIIEAAPHINHLDLGGSGRALGGVILATHPGHLREIQTAVFDYSYIGPQDIQRLFLEASTLRRLSLKDCKSIASSFSDLDEGQLPYLEEVDLKNSGEKGITTQDDATALLMAASKLKKINLGTLYYIPTILSAGLRNFPCLEEIELQLLWQPPSPNDILGLFKTATHLKKLVLNGYRPMEGIFSALAPNSLPHLKELELKHCNMGVLDILQLFNAAPNLERITVSKHGSHWDDDLDRLKAAAPHIQITVDEMYFDRSASSAPSVSEPIPRSEPTHDLQSEPIQSLDADTALKSQTFHVDKIFYPMGDAPIPAPNDYRLNVFQIAETNPNLCDMKEAFQIKQTDDLQLVECDIPRSLRDVYDIQKAVVAEANRDLYYAKQTINLSRKWQPLASLSPNKEHLLCYHTDPRVNNIDIKYSERDKLYYIHSTSEQTQTVTIDFALSVPRPKPSLLPADVQRLVNQFKAFKPGALIFQDKGKHTGTDYITALLAQEKGACRHRAFAFKYLMTQLHPEMPVQIISNACHMFVEVQVGDQWHTCDLGGYEAALEINESNQPNQDADEPVVTRTRLQTALSRPSEDESKTEDEAEADITTDFEQYLREFATWETSTTPTRTPLAYYQQSIHPVAHDGTNKEVKNRLIKCASADDVDALHYGLQRYCRSIHRPVFYINSPDDLRCSTTNLQCGADGRGQLLRGRNSRLHRFLIDPQNATGVLVVNYSHFSSDELASFNALLDEKRSADGTDVPEQLLIIGLLNQDSVNPPPGDDFLSRLDEKECCPLSSAELAESIPRLYDATPEVADASLISIDLFQANDWEERLIGRWVPDNGGWVYKQGELTKALAQIPPPTTIEIKNGLWENKDFCRFWREARLAQMIHCASGDSPFSPDIHIVRRDGFNWPLLKESWHQHPHPSAPFVHVLNQATFGNFFSQCKITDQKMNQTPGHIQAAAAMHECHVHATHPLQDNEWAMLLNECETHKVKLHAYVAPGVQLPEALQTVGMQTAIMPSIPWPNAASSSTAIIQSTDIDTTVAQLKQASAMAEALKPSHLAPLVIDISECDESDLLWKMQEPELVESDEGLQVTFIKEKCAVQKALDAGQDVILKGHFSSELAQQLAPLLLRREANAQQQGQLHLVSNNTSAFSYLPQHLHTVTDAEKQALLSARFGPLPVLLDMKEPLSKLAARCRFLQKNPRTSSDKSWAGLDCLPDAIKDPGALSIENAAQKAAAFKKDRLDAVQTVLATEPYVFLTGLSGVGKTTFVRNELCQDGSKLYQEEASILAWATDNTTPNQKKYLFLDEANLSASNRSAFEGLFDDPQGILIHGQQYPLSKDHKVIFAGNPTSYGDERKLAPFFKRHGNAVVFELLPSGLLYTDILMPVFEGTDLADQAPEICASFIDMYRFLCLCSETDVLISPRELQMMALLTLSYCRRHEMDQVNDIARYFARQLASRLVPETNRAAFDRQFPEVDLPERARIEHKDYHITPSRQHVSVLLHEFLNLHEARLDTVTNTPQAYGGLGGIILEGTPGLGKSDLVLHALHVRGYEKQNLDYLGASTTDHRYYHMLVSMSLDDKERLLRQAFNEGALVVIDEINSSPMMEKLLNALLMGTTPEGHRPTHPGFTVIGTQNPITMAGRRAASKALECRTTKKELPDYPREEMYSILLKIGLPEKKASDLVLAYEIQKNYAVANHLNPIPNFRDLMKAGKRVLRGLSACSLVHPQPSDQQKKAIDHRLTYLKTRVESCWPNTNRAEMSCEIPLLETILSHSPDKALMPAELGGGDRLPKKKIESPKITSVPSTTGLFSQSGHGRQSSSCVMTTASAVEGERINLGSRH